MNISLNKKLSGSGRVFSLGLLLILLVMVGGPASAAVDLTSIPVEGNPVRATDVVTDAYGNIHLVYYDSTDWSVKYMTNEGGAWSVATIGWVGQLPGSWTDIAIALAADGSVLIGYADGTASNLMLTRIYDGFMTTSILATGVDLEMGFDFELGPDGSLALVYATARFYQDAPPPPPEEEDDDDHFCDDCKGVGEDDTELTPLKTEPTVDIHVQWSQGFQTDHVGGPIEWTTDGVFASEGPFPAAFDAELITENERAVRKPVLTFTSGTGSNGISVYHNDGDAIKIIDVARNGGYLESRQVISETASPTRFHSVWMDGSGVIHQGVHTLDGSLWRGLTENGTTTWTLVQGETGSASGRYVGLTSLPDQTSDVDDSHLVYQSHPDGSIGYAQVDHQSGTETSQVAQSNQFRAEVRFSQSGDSGVTGGVVGVAMTSPAGIGELDKLTVQGGLTIITVSE